MVRWLCLLVPALLAAGCAPDGGQRRATVADPAGGGLLLAYEAGNHQHRYGGRVFADGRYELYSTSEPLADPDWKAYEPFTAEQLEEIRQQVDEALAAGLPSRISAGDPPPPDAATARFTLGDREIVVGNWPANAPPEIEALLDRIAALRRRPPVPSTWRLWSRGEVVELHARCEIGDVEVLSALRDAIFMPAAPPAAGRGAPSGADPPAGTPLVRITFAAKRGDEVLDVFADGRRIDRTPVGGDRVRELDDDRMAAIRQALDATDWSALPARLC
jgi:hypothetical protein